MGAVAALCLAASPCADPPEGVDVLVTVEAEAPAGVSRFRPGITHTQYTANVGDPDAMAAVRAVLPTVAAYQNQHIMGWGAMNPEPSPGVYDWSSLDHRVHYMREGGDTLVITLCCAPDWMKGGQPGTTDWSKLETAPLPEHFDDFAELARQVAVRYPDVTHFQVWNELKGFWNRARNRWDYEGYTDLYNRVYRALKSVNPAIQVGGPYVVLRKYSSAAASAPFPTPDPELRDRPYGTLEQRPLDAVEYWLRHNEGADFIVVDGHSFSQEAPDPDPVASTVYFADATRWLRRRTALPIWWAEWYTTPFGADGQWDHAYQNVVMTSALIHMLKSGADVALRWAPQGVAGRPYEGNNESIWSDTRAPGGGRPFPFAQTHESLLRNFGPGVDWYELSSTSPQVFGIASRSRVLLVNSSAAELRAEVEGALTVLPGHSVTEIPRTETDPPR